MESQYHRHVEHILPERSCLARNTTLHQRAQTIEPHRTLAWVAVMPGPPLIRNHPFLDTPSSSPSAKHLFFFVFRKYKCQSKHGRPQRWPKVSQGVSSAGWKERARLRHEDLGQGKLGMSLQSRVL